VIVRLLNPRQNFPIASSVGTRQFAEWVQPLVLITSPGLLLIQKRCCNTVRENVRWFEGGLKVRWKVDRGRGVGYWRGLRQLPHGSR
jgi:hypothetical protein